MMTRTLLTVVALGLVFGSGSAEAAETYMWGVGPRVGTNIIPGKYPVSLPPAVKDDTDANGEPYIQGVRGDVILGAEAVYYVNSGSRIGWIGGMEAGSKYLDLHTLVTYDLVLVNESVDILAGGGIGVATTRFGSDGDASLRVPNYPLRAQLIGQVRNDFMNYQFKLFGDYNLPGNHFYTNGAGQEVDVGSGVYVTVGAEIAVLFGDFTPPRPKKKKK